MYFAILMNSFDLHIENLYLLFIICTFLKRYTQTFNLINQWQIQKSDGHFEKNVHLR